MEDDSRQSAFIALSAVHKGAYADVALERVLSKNDLSPQSRRLVTELVYGSVRQMRSLDTLIDQLASKKADKQPPLLRAILHLGLYQLRYLNHIPPSAAVNTTVELAKKNGLSGLTGFVNGVLRQYLRINDTGIDPLKLPENPVERLGILHSYPNWIIEVWLEQFGFTATEQLCKWLNQPPKLDLRINPLRSSIEKVETALQSAGIEVNRVPFLPQALRITGSTGAIQNLPGFNDGWWTVQDSSAQLVSHLLAPQAGEFIIDACAAPGGKTTHIAELMGDTGTIWACDRTASRLRKLQQNTKRLQLKSIQIQVGDSRHWSYEDKCDRLLLDVPCSGLGTLNRHADARWRQTPESIQELSLLQSELISHASLFVKPGGVMVYATCTLHPQENESVIENFLEQNPNWLIEPPNPNSPCFPFAKSARWIKVLPYQDLMDGFFMVRLKKSS